MKKQDILRHEQQLLQDNLQSRLLVLTRFRAFNSRGLRWRLGSNSNGILPVDYYASIIFEVLFSIFMIVIFFTEQVYSEWSGIVYLLIIGILIIGIILDIINEIKQVTTLLKNREQVLSNLSLVTFKRPNLKMKMLVYDWDPITGDKHRSLNANEQEMYLPLNSKGSDVNGLVKITDDSYYVDKQALLTTEGKEQFIKANLSSLFETILIWLMLIIGVWLLTVIDSDNQLSIQSFVGLVILGTLGGLLITKSNPIFEYFYKLISTHRK